MNLLHRKGYSGSIEASTVDNIPHAKLQFIQAFDN